MCEVEFRDLPEVPEKTVDTALMDWATCVITKLRENPGQWALVHTGQLLRESVDSKRKFRFANDWRNSDAWSFSSQFRYPKDSGTYQIWMKDTRVVPRLRNRLFGMKGK